MMKCKVEKCNNEKHRRHFVCGTCWNKIPREIQLDIRFGIEKGLHTLRAVPDRNWIEKVAKYIGQVKVPYIVGFGASAVRLAADRSEVR